MKTAEESAYFREFLKKLIDDITNEIPDDEQEKTNDLESIKMTLFHRAPEILNNSFLEILSFLRRNIVLYEDDSKNPQYIKNISTIWAKACNEIKNGFETGAATEEIAAPPKIEN